MFSEQQTDLSVLNDKMARRDDQCDKRSREEHFDEGYIGLLGGEDSGEGIGVVDAEAS